MKKSVKRGQPCTRLGCPEPDRSGQRSNRLQNLSKTDGDWPRLPVTGENATGEGNRSDFGRLGYNGREISKLPRPASIDSIPAASTRVLRLGRIAVLGRTIRGGTTAMTVSFAA